MTDRFLDKIYKYNTNISSHEIYEKWAPFYDEELTENQYVTPIRCAQILYDLVSDKKIEILDVGCGTGLSGDALKKFGFNYIDGLDLSEEMLKIADNKKIYTSLFNRDLNNLSGFDKKYDAIIAVGVISQAHANPDIIIKACSILKKNGFMIFSLNDHALNDSSFFNDTNQAIKSSNFILLSQIYGDHIKELKLRSSIFVLQKY